jgi:hypothetical protein
MTKSRIAGMSSALFVRCTPFAGRAYDAYPGNYVAGSASVAVDGRGQTPTRPYRFGLRALGSRSRTECSPPPKHGPSQSGQAVASTSAARNPCTCFVPASGVSCVSGDSPRAISSDFLDFSHGVHVQILSSASLLESMLYTGGESRPAPSPSPDGEPSAGSDRWDRWSGPRLLRNGGGDQLRSVEHPAHRSNGGGSPGFGVHLGSGVDRRHSVRPCSSAVRRKGTDESFAQRSGNPHQLWFDQPHRPARFGGRPNGAGSDDPDQRVPSATQLSQCCAPRPRLPHGSRPFWLRQSCGVEVQRSSETSGVLRRGLEADPRAARCDVRGGLELRSSDRDQRHGQRAH